MKKIISTLIIILIVVLTAFSASARTVEKGDINEDGKVNASDARTTLRVSAKLAECTDDQILIADVTGDSKITAADARNILRRSANLMPKFGTIEIGEKEPEQIVTKTDISGTLGATYSDVLSKYGNLRKSGSTGSVVKYSNADVGFVSDPSIIDGGKFSSIATSSSKYSIHGVYIGMDIDAAVSMLKSKGWLLKGQTSAEALFTDAKTYIKVAVSGKKITKVEYGFSEPLINVEETTTKAPAAEETTTSKAPVQEETTTGSSVSFPESNIEYNDLPKDVKAFVEGKFGVIGYNYVDGKKSAMSMYISDDAVKAGMPMEGMQVDILVKKEKNKTNMYCVRSDIRKFYKLNAFDLLLYGIKEEDFKMDFATGSSTIKSARKENTTIAGVDYVLYSLATDTEICNIYTIDDKIVRIQTVDSKSGMLKSWIDVEKFIADVPASTFSLNAYEQVWLITSLFT